MFNKKRSSMQKRIQILSVFLNILLLQFVKADDGMWMPHQIADLQLESSGLLISPDEIYKESSTGLMNAIINFAGGTGSFVSDEGLILTNHHVAFNALQRASDEKNDYLQNGFLAKTRKDELPAQGLYIDILFSYEDITGEMYDGFSDKMTDDEQYWFLEQKAKDIIAREEEEDPQIRVKVASVFGNRNYYLYRFKRLRDIRIVYAPPIDLGKFGGEIDNWIWPRHTADFTFFRAYISPDGKGTEYSPENVPYRPKSYLKISLQGFREGDFSFVMGYPGKTYRNDTYSEFLYSSDLMRFRMEKYQDLINFYEAATAGDRAMEIKYAGKIKSLHNTTKNYQGKLEGFEKENIYQKKKDAEQDIKDWIRGETKDPLREESLRVFSNMQELIQKKKELQMKIYLLGDWVSYSAGPNLLYIAHYIYRTVHEKEKPDMERDAAYQERNVPFIINKIKMTDRSFDLHIDQQYFKFSLLRLIDMPSDQLPPSLKALKMSVTKENIQDDISEMYQESKLTDPEMRIELLDKRLAELEALNDPLISIARNIESDLKSLREEMQLLTYEQNELTQIYSEILIKKNNHRFAPDANGTIRLTFGTIEGYSPADGIYYLPQTSLGGTIAKNKGEYPFNVPAELIELHRQGDFGNYLDGNLRDVPACFLNTTNVTGGNSGSPTLNAAGELIGLIFDMTYESIIGDYYIIPEYQRTISVDIRYILFITEKFSKAQYIIREMGL
jgi:hypothetical protein